MRWDLGIQVEEKVLDRIDEIKILASMMRGASDPKSLQDSERALLALLQDIAGEVEEIVIQDLFQDESWQEEKVKAVKSARGDLRKVGNRNFKIHTLSGRVVEVDTPYLARRSEGKTRTRKATRRRIRSCGIFPAAVALGVGHHCTPAMLSELCREVMACCSEEEARQCLARRGIDLDIKTVWRLANLHALDSIESRDEMLASADPDKEGEMSGRRVVSSVDGGRIRTRKAKKKGRIPKGKKRRGYTTPWKEPKLLIIYAIDSEGERDRSIPPVIDGTMGNADALATLLVGYLRLLGVKAADKLVIIGDGARWIWDRVNKIVEGVGIDPKKVTTIVDFYHAVEHLQDFAELKKGWSEKFRKQWVTKNRKLLRSGKIKKVIENIKAVAKGRNLKKMKTELNYFIKNASKMKYAWFKRCRLPIGSGAVESCIRRVVNLRMKCPSTYWKEENAEGFLHLRSLYKSGRWDAGFMQTLETQARAVA
jgi:hypothetical protein